MSSASIRFALLPLVTAMLTLAGCAVLPPDEPHYPEYARGTVVYMAPPAPLIEYRSLQPAPNYLWIDGYWNWAGARYAWVPGRWVEPRPNHVWVPPVWRREGEHWRSHGGWWEPSRGVMPVPPTRYPVEPNGFTHQRPEWDGPRRLEPRRPQERPLQHPPSFSRQTEDHPVQPPQPGRGLRDGSPPRPDEAVDRAPPRTEPQPQPGRAEQPRPAAERGAASLSEPRRHFGSRRRPLKDEDKPN